MLTYFQDAQQQRLAAKSMAGYISASMHHQHSFIQLIKVQSWDVTKLSSIFYISCLFPQYPSLIQGLLFTSNKISINQSNLEWNISSTKSHHAQSTIEWMETRKNANNSGFREEMDGKERISIILQCVVKMHIHNFLNNTRGE